MKEKEVLVRRSVFPKPPQSHEPEPLLLPGVTYMSITETKIGNTLMSQSAIKASGPDKINFQVLHMIWNWDKMRIASIMQQSIRLGYHPK